MKGNMSNVNIIPIITGHHFMWNTLNIYVHIPRQYNVTISIA